MKLYFLLWDELPCDRHGGIVMVDSGQWLKEQECAIWTDPREPQAWIDSGVTRKDRWSVFEVEV